MYIFLKNWWRWSYICWKASQRYLCHSRKITGSKTKSGSSWKGSTYQVGQFLNFIFLEKFPWNWNCNIYIFRAKRRWRKAVTGDPNKRIRDYMKETPQVKMQDKFSFTLGVIVICLSEFLILRMPNLFQYFYFALMSVLIAWRYYDYSLIKSELFLMDFCYFVNLSVFLQTVFYPDDLAWFKANYVLTQGPICIAIVVWRNSLVFHR